MTNAFEKAFGAVERSVERVERDGLSMRKVRLSRTYATTVEDLWDAVTNPERLPRWFLPVTGEFKQGGHYQLEGNANGKIQICESPSHLGITWEFGGGMSWVDIFTAADSAGGTRFTLEHIVPMDDHWAQFGPGATGVGWDLSFLGLGAHLAIDHERCLKPEWMGTDEGKDYIRVSSQDWGKAHIGSGADEETAQKRADQTSAAYTGESAPED